MMFGDLERSGKPMIFQRLTSIFNEASEIEERTLTPYKRTWAKALGPFDFKSGSLTFQVLSSDYLKVQSEYLPSLREKITQTALDMAQLHLKSPDRSDASDSNWDLPIQISNCLVEITRIIPFVFTGKIGQAPSEESEQPSKMREILEASKDAESILLPSVKFFPLESKLRSLSLDWSGLIWRYKNYLEACEKFETKKSDVEPSGLVPDIERVSKALIESIDDITNCLMRSTYEYFMDDFVGSARTFGNQIKRYNLLIDEIKEDWERRDTEAEISIVKTWIGIPVLFRLLIRKLFSEDRHSLNLLSSLTIKQLVRLELEFDEWKRNYHLEVYENDWMIHAETADSTQYIFESIEVIRDIFLFDKTPDEIDVENYQLDWDGFDHQKAKYRDFIKNLKVDENDDDEEKVWIKNWLTQISLIMLKIIEMDMLRIEGN